MERERGPLDSLPESIQVSLDADLATVESQFLLYWTVAAWPWRACVASGDYPTAHALGDLFDKVVTKHRWLRRLARTWLEWSESAVHKFAAAWMTSITTVNTLAPAAPRPTPHSNTQPPAPQP